MIKLNIIENVDFSTAGNGQITRTPEGAAIGGIPDWECLIDPAYMISEMNVRQRAKPQSGATLQAPTTLSQFSAGQPAFSHAWVVGAETTGATMPQNASINPQAFTFFGVFQNAQLGKSSSPRPLFYPTVAADDTTKRQVRVTLGRDDGTFGVYSGNPSPATRIAIYTSADLVNMQAPKIFAATFSTTNGWGLHINGVEVARNAQSVTPIDSAYNAGEWCFYRENYGLAGMSGLINRDLSLPENTGFMKELSKFLMDKYGIGS
ncbi:hypothetical protein [Klebsiella quasipneumoniae]|uniref:hypothetical protein n=1 Tax=Klebsiella quasipneumoniae TaxID=1463165 RepID=UPI0019CFA767|nr:hypothetical protein [Klebsiella quasipneumoniae]